MQLVSKKRVFLQWFALGLFLLPIQGRSAPFKNEYAIEDGGYRRVFQVARNEWAVRTKSGEQTFQKIKIAKSADAVRARAKKSVRSTGNVIELILYERGAEHTKYNRRVLTKKVLVTLEEGVDVAAVAKQADVVSWRESGFVPNTYIFEVSDVGGALESADVLKTLAGVRAAEPMLARQRQPRFVPNDPLFTNEWHLLNTGQKGGTPGIDVNITNVWSTYRGTNIVIGIIDDGLQTTHPDLSPNVNTNIDYNWNDGNSNDPNPNLLLTNFHGTAVAGVAAARGNNAVGVSGTAPDATLVGLRLTAAAVTDDQEAEAMSHSNSIIQIKNNSWGPSDDGATLEGPGPLTQAAFSNGVTLGRGGLGEIYVWAGGNGLENYDNANYDGYANSMYTIAVSATADNGTNALYSEPGACLVVTLPSNGGTAGITTTDLVGNNGYNINTAPDELADKNYTQQFGGTSSSAPLASGIIALMLQANPNLGWRDVQELLIRTARQNHPTDTLWTNNAAGFHFDEYYGAGLVDAQAAVTTALTWTNLGAHAGYSISHTNIEASIPDDDTNGITELFSVTSSYLRIEHVTITVDITHTYRGDLAITLTAPSGMQSKLSELHGDSNDDYSAWTFMTVRDWGETLGGTWTLNFADEGAFDIGTLHSVTLTFYGTSDQDSDQITDDWEQSYFGTLTATDGSGDFDDDGFIDLHEYLAGTVPTNAASLLAFTISSNAPDDGVTIQWSSVTNKNYRIEQTTNMFEPFSILATNLFATPPDNIYIDTDSTNIPERYYRIELE